MNKNDNINITIDDLRALFSKEHNQEAPSIETWKRFYSDDVLFQDPTQKTIGIYNYIDAQNKLVKRCKSVYLRPHNILLDDSCAFIEWTMILKISSLNFVYDGTTRLIFGTDGKIKHHRDYFDFISSTFGPVPFLGTFFNWLYKRFVS